MGRRKIDIEPITNERNRTVTFIKRKAGLFKKAHELAVLCNVDIAVIILGTNKQFYEYSSVETDQLIDTYQRKDLQHHVKDPRDYGDGFVKKKFIDVELSPGKAKNRKPKKNESNSQKSKGGSEQETNRELTNRMDEEEEEEEEEEGEEGAEEDQAEGEEETREDKEHDGKIEEYTLDQLGAIGKKNTKRQASQLQYKGTNKKRKLSNPNSSNKSSKKTVKSSASLSGPNADEQETVVKTKSNIKSSNKTQNKKQLRIKTGEKKLDSKMVQQFQQMYSTTLSKSNDSTPNQQRHTVPPPVSSIPSFPSAAAVVAHNNPAYLGSQTITVPAYQQGQQPYQTLSGYSGKPFSYPGSASASTAASLRTGSLNMTNNNNNDNPESDGFKGNSFALNNANSSTLANRLESSNFLTNSGMLRANRTPTTPALLIGGDSLMSRPFGKGNLLTPTQTSTNFGNLNDVAATGGNENNKKSNASKSKKQSNLHHSSRPQLRVEIPNTGREVQSSDASATTESQGVSGTVVDANTSLNENTTTENANAHGTHSADANVGTTNRPYPGTNYGASVNNGLHKTPVSSALPSPLLFDSGAKLPNVSSIPFSAKQQSFNNAANTRVRGNNFFNMSGQHGNNTGNSGFPTSAVNSNMPTNYIPQSAMISPSFQQYFATPLVGPGAYANSGQSNANTNVNNSSVTDAQAGNVDGADRENHSLKKHTHSKKPSLTVNTSSTSLDNTSFSNSEGQPLSATTRTLIGDQSFSERPNIKTNNTKTSGSFQNNREFDSANPYAFKPQLPHINTTIDAHSATVPTSGANPDTINADQNAASLNANGGGLSAVFSPMNYLFQDWGQPPSALPSNTGFPTAQANTLSGLLHNNRNNGQDTTIIGNTSSQNENTNVSDTNKNTQKTPETDDFVLSKDAPNGNTTDTDKENKE